MSVMQSDGNVYFCEAMNAANQSPKRDNNIIIVVISMPGIAQTPPTLKVANIGDDVTLPCAINSITQVTVRYRWTRTGQVVGSDNRVSGNLFISSVREGTEDSGYYVCSVILTADGINAAPLIFMVGATVLTVQGKDHHTVQEIHYLQTIQESVTDTSYTLSKCRHLSCYAEPARPPSKPNIAPPTEVSHTSFRAHWTAPSDTGGLPVVNYTLEYRPTGSSFCTLNSAPWTVFSAGLSVNSVSVLVNENVFPGIGYEYRVSVFTALYSNTSDPASLTTPNSGEPLTPSLSLTGMWDTRCKVGMTKT